MGKRELNKKIFCIFLFVLVIFISCKNNPDSKLVYTEENTIKNSIILRESNITWSRELEPDRLSTKVSKENSSISDDVEYNLDVIRILKNFQKPLYPEFINFGKLDISQLNISVKEKLNSFCSDLSKSCNVAVDSYFNNQYLFNYIFFKQELKNGWKAHFNSEYPELLKDDEQIFDKWVFGQPFKGDEIIQIPVRFYCKHGTVDITLYLNNLKQNSIYQITIDRWEKV